MPFDRSPLFTVANDAIQREMRQRFARSDYGQLVRQLRQAGARPQSERAIARIIGRYKTATPERTIQQLMGADFGSLVRTVERYARGPGGSGGLGKRLLSKFLGSLGPSGKLLRSLAMADKSPAGYRSSLNDAMSLIRSMGGEVIPGKEWGTVEDVTRAVRSMEQRMEEMRRRGEKVESRPPGARGQERQRPGERGTNVTVGGRKYPPNHPIVTGDMVPTPGSTNVYEFGYDADAAYLYVRFKRGGKTKYGDRPNAPGSLYRYANVTPDEFLGLYRLRSSGGGGGPGDWVWDHLRVRGTVSGHQKDYELVGVTGGYVPRKATLEKEPSGKLVEYFIPRMTKTTEGKWIQSRKGKELAPTSGFMVGERGVGGGPRSGANNPRG